MGQTHILRFLQKYLIGFKLRLWLGRSRTFTELSVSHSFCVLWVIVLLEGEPSAQSEVLNGFSLRLSQFFWCIELFFYSDESLSPCCWETAPQHEAATSTLYLWDGTLQVMSRAGFLQTWCLELRFIRLENRVSHSLRVLWVLCWKLQVCFHVFSLRNFLTSGLGFHFDIQLLDLLLRRVHFQIIPNQLNLPQVNFTQSVVTSTSNMKAQYESKIYCIFFLLFHYGVFYKYSLINRKFAET